MARAMNKRTKWLLAVFALLVCYHIVAMLPFGFQYRIQRGSNTYWFAVNGRTISMSVLREHSPLRTKGMGFPEANRYFGIGSLFIAHWFQYSNRAFDQRTCMLNWWVLLLVGVCLAAVYRRYRARARWMRCGCCPNCGYDLRATPQRCPECGRENEAGHSQ
jgi:hypothetical protein